MESWRFECKKCSVEKGEEGFPPSVVKEISKNPDGRLAQQAWCSACREEFYKGKEAGKQGPAADLNESAWFTNSGVLGEGTENGEDGRTAVIRCTIDRRYVGMMQDLVMNPQSSYFGAFRGLPDLHRHLVIAGVLALAERDKEFRGLAISVRLREELAARVAREWTQRQRIQDATELVAKAVRDDLEAGDIASAIAYLDDYLLQIVQIGDIGLVRRYMKALLTHPGFQVSRKDQRLRKASELLVGVEEDYGS